MRQHVKPREALKNLIHRKLFYAIVLLLSEQPWKYRVKMLIFITNCTFFISESPHGNESIKGVRKMSSL